MQVPHKGEAVHPRAAFFHALRHSLPLFGAARFRLIVFGNKLIVARFDAPPAAGYDPLLGILWQGANAETWAPPSAEMTFVLFGQYGADNGR